MQGEVCVAYCRLCRRRIFQTTCVFHEVHRLCLRVTISAVSNKLDVIELTECNEKLRIIRVFSPIIRTSQESSMWEPQPGMNLVFKLFAIEWFAATASSGSITGLDKEVWYDPVEDDAVVIPYTWIRIVELTASGCVRARTFHCQGQKVSYGFWAFLVWSVSV